MENTQSVEQISDINDAFDQLLDLEPKIVSATSPDNKAQAKLEFLNNRELQQPNHVYGKLDAVNDENIYMIRRIGNFFAQSEYVREKYKVVYHDFIESYVKKTKLMRLMSKYRHTSNLNDKSKIREEFMEINKEEYGEPDRNTYLSLLQEKVLSLSTGNLSTGQSELLNELKTMLPQTIFDQSGGQIERFRPAQETVDWLGGVADSLYGEWFDNIPDQATFTKHEIKHIFEDIIANCIGEAANGWVVEFGNVTELMVDASAKKIFISETLEDKDYIVVKKLIAHELGVHVLRSIAGEDKDLHPLSVGLQGYYDDEEGIGKVMAQAVVGKYTEPLPRHYITAGLAYFEGASFRQAFEIKWRIEALANGGDVADQDYISKSQSKAYDETNRIFRGTDELPWFKDLAYYNGQQNVWHRLEEIRLRGDDLEIAMLIQGKVNTKKAHRDVMLESHSLATESSEYDNWQIAA